MYDVSKLIASLQKSDLVAECPNCSEEFALAKSVLFDGRKKFPDEAEKQRLELEQELKQRIEDLKKRQIRADTSVETGAISSGFGKIIEKVLPAYKNFNMPLNDARFLGEPIDYIIFNGASDMKIKQITFLEIKTGKGRLEEGEKMVRDAILDHKLKCEVI
ncbi:MAG: Holliday junction resolvase-like protein [Nitrosotalea sp.]|jgi:predicted Holliday junction resolvase-like endonuclease